MTPCPCGRYPTTGVELSTPERPIELVEVQYTCPNCYDPDPDTAWIGNLRGWGTTEREAGLRWSEQVACWVDQAPSAALRSAIALCDARIDAGTHRAGDRHMARLLRDELTVRHHACEDTIPPPPSVPREERETMRPMRMRECGTVIR